MESDTWGGCYTPSELRLEELALCWRELDDEDRAKLLEMADNILDGQAEIRRLRCVVTGDVSLVALWTRWHTFSRKPLVKVLGSVLALFMWCFHSCLYHFGSRVIDVLT